MVEGLDIISQAADEEDLVYTLFGGRGSGRKCQGGHGEDQVGN